MPYIRILFEYWTYHVYNRGHNKMKIFRYKQDNLVFLEIIRQVQLIYNFQIFAWCLMGNHYHLLLKDVSKNLPYAIGLIQEKYAIYFNGKYNHSGAVFMKPFKSNPVYGRNHFFLLVCYIQNNPVKAGIVKIYNDYIWNSPLFGYEKFNITDYLYVNFYYKPIGGLYLNEYIRQRSSSRIISNLELESLSDDDAKELFISIVKDLSGCNKFSLEILTEQNVKKIVAESLYNGISTRQTSEFTGIAKTTVFRMKSDRTYI